MCGTCGVCACVHITSMTVCKRGQGLHFCTQTFLCSNLFVLHDKLLPRGLNILSCLHQAQLHRRNSVAARRIGTCHNMTDLTLSFLSMPTFLVPKFVMSSSWGD